MIPSSSQRLFASQQGEPSLPPEALLQILAARVNLSNAAAVGMKTLLREAIDWPTLLTDSAKLGTQPLLYKHLSGKEFADHLPPAVLGSLKDAYRKQSIRGLRMYGLIERILTAFEGAGAAVVLLKGAFLGKWIYGDIALRPMGDIDILCRAEEGDLVKATLRELGLHQEAVHPSPFHERLQAVEKGGHLNPFFGARPLMIEVHFSIFPNIPDGFSHMERVWERVSRQSKEGFPLNCLAPADLLFYLCLHLWQHLRFNQCRLYWFSDLHEAIRHYGREVTWDRIFATFAELGVTDHLHPIIRSLNRYWDSDVPEPPGSCKELALEIILGRHVHEHREERQRAIIHGQLAKLVTVSDLQSWPDRVYYLWKLVFPSKENLISRYQPRSALTLGLFAILHPLVLVKRAVISLLYHMSGLWRKLSGG